MADGRIVDAGGPAVTAAVPIAAPAAIPTLSGWGLMLSIALLLVAGATRCGRMRNLCVVIRRGNLRPGQS